MNEEEKHFLRNLESERVPSVGKASPKSRSRHSNPLRQLHQRTNFVFSLCGGVVDLTSMLHVNGGSRLELLSFRH